MNTEKQLLTAGAANVTITIEIDAPLAKTWRAMAASSTVQVSGPAWS